MLEHVEQLGLRRPRDLANLVEEDGAMVGRFDQPWLGPHRAGEGPSLVAKELTLEQGFRDCGAVEHDEPASPSGPRMDFLREPPLAHAGLPEQEDREHAVRDEVDEAQRPGHRFADERPVRLRLRRGHRLRPVEHEAGVPQHHDGPALDGARDASHEPLARHEGPVELPIAFTNDIREINGHDILLVSGALHYCESPLPDLLAGLSERPRHVFVNRTPMTTIKSVVTVQDAMDSLYACKTVHRTELTDGMKELDYELIDSWPVPELSVHIPFYPEYSVPEYTGLYFRLKEANQHVGTA